MLGLILATCIVTVIPGPSMVLIMSNAVDRGLWQGLYTAVGAVVADAILLVLITFGLGALLEASQALYLALKWGGAAYLVYLGIRTLWAKDSGPKAARGEHRDGFMQGLAATLLNPKIAGFLVAFFPQFIEEDGASLAAQLAVLGPVFLLTVLVLFAGFACFAAALVKVVAADKLGSYVKLASGVGLIGCGVYGLIV